MAQASKQQRKKKVIDVLNQARGLELNAIAQYMNHHYNMEAMDFGDMAMNVKLIAIDEMRHAEMFAERIEELGGEPTTAPVGKPQRGKAPRDYFSLDEKLEAHAIDAYNQFLLVCRENGDSTSVKIFEEVIDDEQMHYNYFQSTMAHIEKLGDAFLAQIAGTPSATGITYQGFVARQAGGGTQGAQ